MSRRTARELAMKLLYQLEFQKSDIESQISAFFAENQVEGKDKEFIGEVVDGVMKNVSGIDSSIEAHAKGWKLGRMSKVDLCILRISVYEICFRDDIPHNVSINEAIELAKKFSGEEAGAFINGILGKIVQQKTVPVDGV